MPDIRPLVDVVIPVHTSERPIERAVTSVVADGSGLARVIVACHNLDPECFQNRLAQFGDAIRYVSVQDGIPSPAGPLNAGIAASTAPWVTCMGSDDYYEEGAPLSWAQHLRKRPVDVLFLNSFHMQTDTWEPLLTRPGRTQDLDVVQDRLCYRAGPQSLVRRALVVRHGIRMTEGMRTGEDLAYTLHAYASAPHIDAIAPGAPAYVIGDDGGGRITTGPEALSTVLRPALMLLDEPWLQEIDEPTRRSIAIRMLRLTVYPYFAQRVSDAVPSDIALVRVLASRWTTVARGVTHPMSLAERALTRALLDLSASDSKVIAAAQCVISGPLWKRGLPENPLALFDSESRFNHLVALASFRRRMAARGTPTRVPPLGHMGFTDEGDQ